MLNKLIFGGNWLTYGFYMTLAAVLLTAFLWMVIFFIKLARIFWKSISEEKIIRWATSIWKDRIEKKKVSDIIREGSNKIITTLILIVLTYFCYRTLLPLIDQIKNGSIAEGNVIGILTILLTFISISATGVYFVIYN